MELYVNHQSCQQQQKKKLYQTHMTMQVPHTNGLALSKNLDTKIQEKYHHSNHAPDIPIHILTSQPH